MRSIKACAVVMAPYISVAFFLSTKVLYNRVGNKEGSTGVSVFEKVGWFQPTMTKGLVRWPRARKRT